MFGIYYEGGWDGLRVGGDYVTTLFSNVPVIICIVERFGNSGILSLRIIIRILY